MSKAKSTAKAPEKRILGECSVGDIAQTPAGHLLVMNELVGNQVLVRLWHPTEKRYVSGPFCVSPELAVLGTSRPPPPPPTIGGDYDPLKGA